jgi:hypothetical protein
MKSFLTHFYDLSDEYLEESLNTPVEFYMTDDTKMPREIHAAYEIDGNKYGISLVLTKTNRVYMLDMYRIRNNQKRYWTFVKSQDIRKSLSTIIKFMEACYPFLEGKVDGILVNIPGKIGSEKFVSFLSRMLKRSYVKKFKEVPVVKTSEKAMNYLFMVRRGVQPNTIFTSAIFKNFNFDGSPDQFNDKVMDVAAEPYIFIKKTASIEPSKKFAFGVLKVELSADTEMVNMLDNAVKLKAQAEAAAEKPTPTSVPKEYSVGVDIKSGSYMPPFIETRSTKSLTVSFPHLMAILLPNAFQNIKQKGFDLSKINYSNLKVSAIKGFEQMPPKIQNELVKAKLFSADGIFLDSPDNTQLMIETLSSFTSLQSSDIDKLSKKLLQSKENNPTPVDPKQPIVGTKLKLEAEPISIIPSFESSNTSSANSGDMGFIEDSEDIWQKIKAVQNMPEVKEWYSNYNINEKNSKNLWKYTGSDAQVINNQMRSSLGSGKIIKWSILAEKKSMILNLMRHFKTAPKLDSGIWVYRNALKKSDENYEVGQDYIDPAFFSTSVNSTMSLGSNGGLRLKIYVPKGTRCYPMLGHSKHSHENEIVFPPVTVLRITESYTNKNTGRVMLVCVMMGSAFEDTLKLGSKGVMLEQTKNKTIPDEKPEKKYNPEDKWLGGPTKKQSDAIKDMIKSGKIKVRF